MEVLEQNIIIWQYRRKKKHCEDSCGEVTVTFREHHSKEK